MALTINTNIKNDADGYLLDAKNVKVTEGEMLDKRLDSLQINVKNAVDTPLETNTVYELGTLSGDLTLTLPDNASSGELLYICFTNTSHSVTLVGSVIGSVQLAENCFNELMFMRVGSKWSVAHRGTVA